MEGLNGMKRFRRAALSGLVALGMLAMVPAAVFAAQPSCGDTLTANTTLTADLDCSGYAGDALVFGKGGITLNLNGHTIWGPAAQDNYDGVETDGYNHVTVTNGTIANFTYGVDNSGSSSSSFTWLTITGELADTSDYGIYQSYGAGNTYRHLHVTGEDIGVYLEYGASDVIRNNAVAGASEDFYFYYESTDVIGSNVANGDTYGFYDYYGAHNRYTSNKANGHSSEGFYLYCDDFGYVVLRNNIANGNGGDGFYLYYCYDDNNEAHGSSITGNTAKNNGASGFDDFYSLNSNWTHNFAKGNTDDGFYFDYPGVDTIRYNLSTWNGDDGFDLVDADGAGYDGPADLSFNTARHNTSYGFTSDYGVPGEGNIAQNNGTNCYDVVCN